LVEKFYGLGDGAGYRNAEGHFCSNSNEFNANYQARSEWNKLFIDSIIIPILNIAPRIVVCIKIETS
jgi:hypothetical protein